MRTAVVSGHAGPLAVPGGADAAGRNVYVARPGEEPARRGPRAVRGTRRHRPAAGARPGHGRAG
ncbi:hypothetical protein AB0A94_21870 [Streptomyces sp. NPDC044984]|uniref:hypothetical protein n=1 Tax=Streptomyces sp. NPDC044984 TaxID=3154335 RepID=UPI0034070592